MRPATIPMSSVANTPSQEQVAAMTDEQVDRLLAEGMARTADGYRLMAIAIAEKERRGHDLSKIRSRLIPYLRAFMTGSLMIEMIVLYGTNKLRHIAAMPLEEQKKLADNPTVDVVVGGGHVVKCRLSSLPEGRNEQVIGPNGIRPVGEQKLFVREYGKRNPKKAAAVRKSYARAIPETQEIAIGKSRAPAIEVMAAISALSADTDYFDDSTDAMMHLHCSETAKRRREANAKKAGVTLDKFLNDCLKRGGADI